MTKNDQNLIAVHDALVALGITRAFFRGSSGGWFRYTNRRLSPNMFTFGPANGPIQALTIIGRPKPKAKA